MMLLAAADYLSFSSSVCFFRDFNFKLGLNSRRRRVGVRCCRATLITSSDSFEVGRLIGSYGFMNVTRFVLFSELRVISVLHFLFFFSLPFLRIFNKFQLD